MSKTKKNRLTAAEFATQAAAMKDRYSFGNVANSAASTAAAYEKSTKHPITARERHGIISDAFEAEVAADQLEFCPANDDARDPGEHTMIGRAFAVAAAAWAAALVAEVTPSMAEIMFDMYGDVCDEQGHTAAMGEQSLRLAQQAVEVAEELSWRAVQLAKSYSVGEAE